MSVPTYNLVHVNIAAARASFDDPMMKGFVDRIDEIDGLAQSRPGFVSQPELPDEGRIYTGNTLVNVSIWESVEDLRQFTYASRHADILKMRAEWFVQSEAPNYVLYWGSAEEVPTEVEIKRRFDYLHQRAATPFAFSFKHTFSLEEMLDYTYEEQG